MADAVESSIKRLIKKGKERGYLTYEEMNDDLPDEAVSPDRLDGLLMALDEEGIELIDEAEAEQRGDFADGAEAAEVRPGKTKEKKRRADELEEVSRRIDDPVRMYLTQMGEIPLLTRPQEIALAKKIEMTRMHFRRRVLESDYCIQQAVEILHQVHAGNLPFDRTMKVSTAENLSKETISDRMPTNLATAERIIRADIEDWALCTSPNVSEEVRRRAHRRLWRRRRRAATLVEELSLRTSKIQPLMRKLQHICDKMEELQREIASSRETRTPPEDVEVMKEESEGLIDLVLESPICSRSA